MVSAVGIRNCGEKREIGGEEREVKVGERKKRGGGRERGREKVVSPSWTASFEDTGVSCANEWPLAVLFVD